MLTWLLRDRQGVASRTVRDALLIPGVRNVLVCHLVLVFVVCTLPVGIGRVRHIVGMQSGGVADPVRGDGNSLDIAVAGMALVPACCGGLPLEE